MKNYKLTSFLAIAISLLLFGCSKDTIPTSTSVNPPFVALYYPPYVSGTGQWQPDGYIFYDLDHDDNKDKKFFVARFKFISGNVDNKMEIYKGPLPIDSIAQNWPPEVKSVGFGFNTDMIVNAYMGLYQMGLDSLGRSYYYYDSLKSINIVKGHGLTTELYTGVNWLNGKTPQGVAVIRIPDGVGGLVDDTYRTIFFYFKERAFVKIGNFKPPMSLNQLVPGGAAAKYDWENVSSVIENKNIWGFNTFIFIDFKNWRYFTWQEECAPGGCLSYKLTLSDYKSLDGLLDWPAGWKK